jgi:cytochrome c oxidase assembly protein subunit 15
VLATAVLQVSVGVGIVWFGMPLPLATSHNGVAAILLLTVINLLNATSFPARLRSGATP